MTAVEWFAEQMITNGKLTPELFEKAKEMEKEQQDEQWEDGFDHGYYTRYHDDDGDEFLDN